MIHLQLHNNIIQTKLLFHTANTYGETVQDTNLFFISNYCYTEIEELHNRMYTHILLPKVSHGFMAWNMIPTYDFGFDFKKEIEYPKTGDFNYYLYF